MSEDSAAGMVTSVCRQCGAPFRCGMENGDKECWCSGLPALSSIPAQIDGHAAATCLCPACLKARLATDSRS